MDTESFSFGSQLRVLISSFLPLWLQIPNMCLPVTIIPRLPSLTIPNGPPFDPLTTRQEYDYCYSNYYYYYLNPGVLT